MTPQTHSEHDSETVGGAKLSVDEFTGRGLEDIHDPLELSGSLQTVILATPKTVPREKVLELFEQEWKYVRGDS